MIRLLRDWPDRSISGGHFSQADGCVVTQKLRFAGLDSCCFVEASLSISNYPPAPIELERR